MPENPLHALRDRLAAEAAEEEFVIYVQAVRELDAGLREALSYLDDWRRKALKHKGNHDLHRAYCAARGKPDWSTPVAFAEQLVAQLIRLHPQKGG